MLKLASTKNGKAVMSRRKVSSVFDFVHCVFFVLDSQFLTETVNWL